LQHDVHKPELGRYLHLVGGIPVSICILPLKHVGDDVLDGEHGRAINPWLIRFRQLMVPFQNSRYVGYGHLDASIVDGRDKDVWPAIVLLQILIKDRIK
jgi:hypothetical protein